MNKDDLAAWNFALDKYVSLIEGNQDKELVAKVKEIVEECRKRFKEEYNAGLV
jgi:hypothetical protein